MIPDVRIYNSRNGFSLVEALIGIAVFTVIAASVYEGYTKIMSLTRVSRVKITAASLANERFEIIRNMPYSDVGIISGIPVGKIPANQIFVRDGIEFQAKTAVRNIDDPFDGTIGGTPNDTAPADYKLVELEISCSACKGFQPLKFDTTAAPKSLEGTSTNGALFVKVFDANGQPIVGAGVHIENNQAIPAIVIDDVTNNSGLLQIVDAPPGIEAYEVTVSKTGYSSAKTYTPGAVGNPNPVMPHATILAQQVTQISFAIDKVSTLNVSSITDTCSPVGGIDFSLKGSKLIGTSPDVFKYSQNKVTDSFGLRTIGNLEWDNYNFILTDGDYNLRGSIPLTPLNLAPNTTQNLQLVVIPALPLSLLITVKDAGTQLPLSGVSVRLEKSGYDNTLITGRGFLRQTNWSGGAGQADFVDPTRYFDSDGNVQISTPPGELKLKKVLGDYVPSGELTSSTFDTGSVSNFYQISWQPQDQPPEAGPNSIRFKIATNNDKTTWNYLGPDGTASTFYTLSNTNISSVHNGARYLRYKVFLQTANSSFTPNLAEVAFTFSSLCVPPGQVLFSSLSAATYTITVSKTGYTTFIDTVDMSPSWQERQVFLGPE